MYWREYCIGKKDLQSSIPVFISAGILQISYYLNVPQENTCKPSKWRANNKAKILLLNFYRQYITRRSELYRTIGYSREMIEIWNKTKEKLLMKNYLFENFLYKSHYYCCHVNFMLTTKIMANETYHSFLQICKLFVVNCKWIKQKWFGIKSMSWLVGTLQKNS